VIGCFDWHSDEGVIRIPCGDTFKLKVPGSFDCGDVRCASLTFAQDDRMQDDKNASSILKQAIERFPGIAGSCCFAGRGLLFHSHADRVEGAIVASVFAGYSFWDRLHALEAD
jgi:hypothetical protein